MSSAWSFPSPRTGGWWRPAWFQSQSRYNQATVLSGYTVHGPVPLLSGKVSDGLISVSCIETYLSFILMRQKHYSTIKLIDFQPTVLRV